MSDFRTSHLSTDSGMMYTTVQERQEGAWCALPGLTTIIETRYFGLIDLSDTVNFPHSYTGGFNFTFLRLSVDKTKNSRGIVALGIITRVDSVSADITYIANASFTENDTPSIELNVNLAPQELKTDVDAGKLVSIKTNGVLLGVTAVNTTVTLTGPGTNFSPAVGDCIVQVTNLTGGNINFAVAACYYSHPTLVP